MRAGDNTTLVTITEVKPIFVNFTLPRRRWTRSARISRRRRSWCGPTAATTRSCSAEGKLTLIDNVIDQATGTIRLKARFDNEDESLWPGEFVRVRVVLAMRRGSRRCPRRLFRTGPNGHYAYIIKPDDTVERRAVEIAAIQDGIAVVTKGLSPGERVVVSGQYRLTQGARVKVSASATGSGGLSRPSGRSKQEAKSIADEHFRALYPPADRDLAADAGGARLRHRRLQPVAGGGAAEGRFPDDRRIGQLSRRQPGHDGLGGRDTARAAIRRDSRPRPDDLDERHRARRSITLQFDLERNIDAAAQDVQTAINAASGLLPKDLPNPPTYRKTNPADRPVLIYAVHSDAMPVYRIDDYAYTNLAQKLSTMNGVSEVADLRPEDRMRCMSRSTPARWRRAASASKRCAPR